MTTSIISRCMPLAAVACLFAIPASMAASPVELNPTDDAHVDSTGPSTNYGSDNRMRVRQGFRTAYLKFNLSQVSGDVQSAVLEIHAGTSNGAQQTTGVHAVSNTSWSESTITWNNRPSVGSLLDSVAISGTGYALRTLDVTQYIQSELAASRTTISLALDNLDDASANTLIRSKEFNNSSLWPTLVITVSAESPPSITQHPQSQTVEHGDNAQFSVAATGNPEPAYQWRKDGNTISGETGTTLTIASAQFADAGSYDVVVTNSLGSATSDSATLTVVDTTPPTVPTGLASSNVTATTVDLNWNASTDNVGVAGYKVYTNGANPKTVSGTATTMDGLAAETNYSFTVSAFDAADNESAQSDPLQVTTAAISGEPLLLTPTDDAHVDSTSPGTNYGSDNRMRIRQGFRTAYLKFDLSQVSGDVQSAILEIHAGTSNGAQQTTRVHAVASTSWSESTITWNNRPSVGSLLDSVAISGTGYALRTLDVTPYVQSELAASRTAISLALDNLDDASANTLVRSKEFNNSSLWPVLVIGVQDPSGAAPFITQHPQNQTVESGQNAQFSVTASGDPDPAYQWRKDGNDISGATSSTLVINNSASADEGSYDVVVSNIHGSVTSNAATLTVVETPPPSDPQTSNGDYWQTFTMTEQFGWFTVTFNAVPHQNQMDGVTGILLGTASGYNDLACIFRFNASGQLDVRNGGSYAADATINYSAESSYLVRMEIDLPNKTYSVFVTPAGQSQITLATNYAFRTQQASVTSLDSWAIYAESGSHTVSDMTWTSEPDTEPPTAPGNLTATAISQSSIDLDWEASTDNVMVAGYDIYRDSQFLNTTTATFYPDSGLQPSTTYSYVVFAFDPSNNVSPPSNTAQATTFAPDTEPPTAPANLTATAISSSRIDLEWDASTDNVGVVGYDVYRNSQLIDTTANTSYPDAGLQPNTTYSYHVIAFDAAENVSPPSNTAQATTLDTSQIVHGSDIPPLSIDAEPFLGVPQPGTLPEMPGRIFTDGEVIEGMQINGQVRIASGARVIFRDCVMVGNFGASGNGYTVRNNDGGGAWVTLERCLVITRTGADGKTSNSTKGVVGWGDTNVEIRQCVLRGGLDVVHYAPSNSPGKIPTGDPTVPMARVLIEESWLGDGERVGSGHADIIQINGCNTGYVVIRRNRVMAFNIPQGSDTLTTRVMDPSTASMAAVCFIHTRNTNDCDNSLGHHHTFRDNWFDGGNFVVQTASGMVSPVELSGNRWGLRHNFGPHHGFSSQKVDNRWGVSGETNCCGTVQEGQLIPGSGN